MPGLQEVLPLFSVAVKRSVDELHSRVESFIKEQFTAIHPVVEWRFRKTVLGAMERPGRSTARARWSRSSSATSIRSTRCRTSAARPPTARWAIQADLLKQLGLAREVLRAAHDARALPILDQLTHRIDAARRPRSR